MSYKVNFNGSNLSDYCTVLNIERTLLPTRINSSKSIPTMNGSFYTGYHYEEKFIKVEILINETSIQDLKNKLSNIKKILDVGNPSKLIISDEPNLYYYAVLDGSTDLSKIGRTTGSATLTFICHDPVAYSNKWSTFSPGARNIIEVDNEGTVAADPLVDVIFKKKACFFQATNRSGETVLIGTPKDIGKTNQSESDILVDDACTDSAEFTTLAQSLIDSNRVVNGAFGVGFNGNGIVCTNYGSDSDAWHGAAFRKSIGKNVSEFEVTIDLTFSSQGKNYVAPTPVPTPPTAPPATGPTCLGTYKVVNCGGLWINRDANTNNPLYAMAPGTLIYPTEIKGNWAKHVHSNKWNTFTGWSSTKYLQKVSNSGRSTMQISTRAEEYAENQLGLMEIYGYDQSGAKLFKTEITDSSEWFENVEPKMYIGGSKVLEDSKITTPVRTQKNSEGKDENAASGAVGRWNDLTAKIIIRREKNAKGEYLWNFTINKYSSGKLVQTMSTKNSLNSPSYPNGDLNYIGFYLGQYADKKVVDVMAINNISVKKLNMKTDSFEDGNIYIFEPNDTLQVNFANGNVLKNGVSISTQIDIGSSFFKVPSGESEFVVRSDDDTAIICCGIQHKYL